MATALKQRTRLYVADAGIARLELCDAESLNVKTSLRLESGDLLGCFKGDSMEYIYRVESATKRLMTLVLVESKPNPCDVLPETRVLIALTKGKTVERMVRDLVPLGATQLTFFRAERSVRLPLDKHEGRLRKIAIEVCRQCGRSSIPGIQVVDQSLQGLVDSGDIVPSDTFLFLETEDVQQDVETCSLGDSVSLVFGPEGGFSPDEIAFIRQNEFVTLSLGERILRSELAAVVGMALVQSKRGLLSPTTNSLTRKK